jgi:Fe-S-cluster containining protein
MSPGDINPAILNSRHRKVPGVLRGNMFNNWTEAILKEYPKLGPESKFKFSCNKGLDCFTQCCADVNIFLTPYDVLRIRKALKMSSGEFIEKYTITPFLAEQKLPLVLLRMQDDDRKTCPFVTAEGCSIYEDRPWSCRMFPLGMASSKTTDRPEGQEFCFILKEGFACLGFDADKEWTVADWWRDQGIDVYERQNQPYKEITLHPMLSEGKGIGINKNHVFFVTCYDLDRFRRLVLESSFLKRFDIDPELVEKLKTDDEALLDFGFKWLRFSLFGEKTIKVRDEELARKQKELAKQKSQSKSKSKSKRAAHEKNRKLKLSG